MANWYNPRIIEDTGTGQTRTPRGFRAPRPQPQKPKPTPTNRPWWINPDDEEAQGRPTTTVSENDPRMIEARRANAEAISLAEYNAYMERQKREREQAQRDELFQTNVWNPYSGPVESAEAQQNRYYKNIQNMTKYQFEDWYKSQPPRKAKEDSFNAFMNLVGYDMPNFAETSSTYYTREEPDFPTYQEWLDAGNFGREEYEYQKYHWDTRTPALWNSRTPAENITEIFSKAKRERNLKADSFLSTQLASIYSAFNNASIANQTWAREQMLSIGTDPRKLDEFLKEARNRGMKIGPTFYEIQEAQTPTQEQVQQFAETTAIQDAYQRAANLFPPAKKGFDKNNPPANTLEWYMKGVREGWIYDPEVSKNLKGGDYTSNYYTKDPVSGQDIRYYYGPDPFTGEIGFMPIGRLERSKDRLVGGNWLLPTLSDTKDYEWYSGMMHNGSTHDFLKNTYLNLLEFRNRNKMGISNSGELGLPWQGMMNTPLGIDFQLMPAIEPIKETEEPPPPDDGGGYGYGSGGGGGYAYTGGTNPFYYTNPPGGGGGGSGYGSRGYGYTGQYSNPANYYNNEFRGRRGEHFSELARWVI